MLTRAGFPWLSSALPSHVWPFSHRRWGDFEDVGHWSDVDNRDRFQDQAGQPARRLLDADFATQKPVF
jgi:hypothetical protein